ncbi:transcriptional regulator [Bifidobacterium vespertilionis]|uniref:ArsR family transcriptional regulator n=1 Tax=Bifidobacterium vespertilionis TaxID=2562524 RepID=A0A5J5E307_9BIFI|nr:transcriptional regulator [Bifidobacterium vespertilionis]KAA8822026.1 ArsR family transcriptional regulator [Bifidobacterium vespertilionis]KAA8823533.1 ArsR family transcriptional regulator [Bifidobacterium vespertilionis]
MATPVITAQFNEVIHAPMRLRICGLLQGAGEVEFAAIRDMLGVSDAVCSKHLKVLSDNGYVTLAKRPGQRNGHDVTWVSLTDEGREAFESHIAALQAIAGLG